jgi:hypothetical protein
VGIPRKHGKLRQRTAPGTRDHLNVFVGKRSERKPAEGSRTPQSPSTQQPTRYVMHNYIMQRTQISLTEEDRSLLDAEAARTGRSISALIRDAVAKTYGFRRDAEQDVQAIDGALGAWHDREIDGELYVERIRSSDRLRQSTAR